MAITAAVWVHGNAVQAIHSGPHLNEARFGQGTSFKTEKFPQWFNFAVTTPVILNNKRPVLRKVFVLYETVGSAKITDLQVFDGKSLVKSFTGLQLEGNHADQIDNSNSWNINPALTIKYGLGLTVRVEFGVLGAALPAIMFTSAGADFE